MKTLFLWIVTSGFLLMSGVSYWFYSESTTLQEELDSARAALDKPEPVCEPKTVYVEVPSHSDTEENAKENIEEEPAKTVENQKDDDEEQRNLETRAERRRQRQAWITTMLGRGIDESEDEYRDRLVPLMTQQLAKPREELETLRKEAEEIAGVTEEQSKELDQIFGEVYEEALTITNEAINSGDLTPYTRNPSGVLSYMGGLGMVLANSETRIGEVLTEQQLSTMLNSGFDWAEYLGVQAPWETLTPPPPPTQ